MALLEPYSGPWTEDEAAHLARRAGFGADPDMIQALVDIGPEQAVAHFVDYDPVDAALEATFKTLPRDSEGLKLRNPQSDSELQGWWLYRMVNTTQPLQEQLTLFFHNMLVSAYSKVNNGVAGRVKNGNDGSQSGQQCNLGSQGLPPDSTRKRKIAVRMMKDQYDLFSQTGNGHYRRLLINITHDPAMLIYLDNRTNKAGKPQENYAREIMELFSMGVGNYTEEDVREIARAFTGETINTNCSDNWPYTYIFKSNWHDYTPKTVFGRTFNFFGDGFDTYYVIDLILNHISGAVEISPAHERLPATSLYVSWKLLNWFVHESIPIDHPVVEELAVLFSETWVDDDRYHIGETLRKLFSSQFFYQLEYRYTMTKNPADYVVMALRNLGLEEAGYTDQARKSLERMGMRLFSPPNVAGWNNGRAWINSGFLLNRYNYADRLSTYQIATTAWADALIADGFISDENDHAGLIEYFHARLIQTPLSVEEQSILEDFLDGIKNGRWGTIEARFRRKVRGLIHIMMTLPRYQLK